MLSLFVLCLAVQCGFAVFFMGCVRQLLQWPATGATPPVSVVICARNEATSLKEYLPQILKQTYTDATGQPLYEVIVVNDGSTDDSAAVLTELAQQHVHLRIVSIPAREAHGKKNALRNGVAMARYDLLLLTDADCRPASRDWLSLMTAPLSQGKEIVAGYGAYTQKEGDTLNALTQWETLHTFMQYSAYIVAGIPYMAVGRNLACTREVLLAAMQHPVWNKLPSGDDDLLVSIAGTATNMAVVCERGAFTFTASKTAWREWVHQKQRHMSTGKYYKWPVKLLLGAYAITHAGMWIMGVCLLFTTLWAYALTTIAIRCLLAYMAWHSAARRLGQNTNFLAWIKGDIGWIIYNFAFLPYITWKNKTNWK